MHSLPIFVRLTGKPVILVGTGEAADAKRRILERAGAQVVGEDAAAQLAIVVDDDAAVARLKSRNILVNAVDRVELCDFTLPAIVDREPVLIAIGTGGASAGLAAALRQRLEAMLPANLGTLAQMLQAARDRLRERWPDPSDRRKAIARALDGSLELTAVKDRLYNSSADEQLVRLMINSADPDDLTLRTARLLSQADRIYHAPGIAPAILERARADAIRIAGLPPGTPEPGLTLILELA